MELPVIRIGNSRGIRLSREILSRYKISDKIELIQKDDHIIIKPVDNPREGWDDAFRKMHESNDDTLLIDDIFDDETFDEWM